MGIFHIQYEKDVQTISIKEKTMASLDNNRVRVFRTRPNAKLPVRAHRTDAGNSRYNALIHLAREERRAFRVFVPNVAARLEPEPAREPSAAEPRSSSC